MDTEEEQVEQIKAWFKQNGMSIVLGIVIGVGGIGGYRYWDYVQETTAEQASDYYSQMMSALGSADSENVELYAGRLISEFDGTEYALLAYLALARHQVSQDAFEQAQDSLQQALEKAGTDPIGFVARTRLAMVQLQLQEYDQAMSTLSADYPAEFAAVVAELKGDVLAQQGKLSEAAEAYRNAMQADPGPANGEFVQQKLEDLGVAG
ncbi:MAG: tetratricopeptide repeat protein [Pseudomonadota bacterium]